MIEPNIDQSMLTTNPGLAQTSNQQFLALLAEYYRRQDHKAIIGSYQQALLTQQQLPEVLLFLAISLEAEQQITAALSAYQQCLAQDPQQSVAHYRLASLLMDSGAFDQARDHYQQVLRLIPNHLETLYNLGLLEHTVNDLMTAKFYYEKVISLQPNYVAAWCNLAAIAMNQSDLVHAKNYLERALAIDPIHVNSLLNMSDVLRRQRYYSEALTYINAALQQAPTNPQAHYNKAMVLFKMNKWSEAIKHYRWRWLTPECAPHYLGGNIAHWLGGQLTEEHLLIWAEQGVGDCMMVLRLLPLAKQKVANITVCVPSRLLALCRLLQPNFNYITPEQLQKNNGCFDYQIALLDLISLFKWQQIKTYFSLVLDYEFNRQRHLYSELIRDKYERRYLIGISWQSLNAKENVSRNIPLELLLELQTIFPEAVFVALQSGIDREAIENFNAATGAELHVENINCFQQYLQYGDLINACDLVITCDNTTAHFAGVLNQETWLLLPWGSDWRWHDDCRHTDWYPSLRCFTQTQAGDWQSVVSHVKSKLKIKRKYWLQKDNLVTQSKAVLKTDPRQAIRLGKKLLTITKKPAYFWLRLAQAYYYANQPKQAWITAKIAYGLLPNDRNVQRFYINIALINKEYVIAYPLIKQFYDAGDKRENLVYSLAYAANELKSYEEAERYCLDYLAGTSDSLLLTCQLGIAWYYLQKYQQASQCFMKIPSTHPDYYLSRMYLGGQYFIEKKYIAAIEKLEEARTHLPYHLELIQTLALCYQEVFNFSQALKIYQIGLSIDPEHIALNLNIGAVYERMNDFVNAQIHTDIALQCATVLNQAKFNKAIMLLKQGKLQEAWHYHTARHEFSNEHHVKSLKGTRKLWRSTAELQDRRVLLVGEQGFGDTLMFIRFIPLLKQYGAKVILACQPALYELLTEQSYIDEVVSAYQPLPDYDYVLPLLDLPEFFDISINDLRGEQRYIVTPENYLTKWKNYFSTIKAKKVGIMWSGNIKQPQNKHRLCPLLFWRALWEAFPDYQWISFQRDQPLQQLLPILETTPLLELGSQCNNFADTAAALQQLDLVITVDTSLAHLAGALGCKTFLLASQFADWRWFLERTDSPWYDSMRIFRQTKVYDWEPPIAKIIQTLRAEGL